MQSRRLVQPQSDTILPQVIPIRASQTASHSILKLQAAIGNRATNQWLAAQPKTSGTRQPIQAKTEFQGVVQALLGESSQTQALSATPALSTATSQGKSLPETVQEKMEKSFNTDFSDVRIHEGSAAKKIGAIAYTCGLDIHFAPGKYNPESQTGQQLLGHELAHVIQQRAGRVSVSQDGDINVDHVLEHEADISGAKVAAGESVAIAGTGSNITSAGKEQARVCEQGMSKVQCAGLATPQEYIDYYAYRFRNFGKKTFQIGTLSRLKTLLDESKSLRAQWVNLEQDQTQGEQSLGWIYNPFSLKHTKRIKNLQNQYLNNLKEVALGFYEFKEKTNEEKSDTKGVIKANLKYLDNLKKVYDTEIAWLRANREDLGVQLRQNIQDHFNAPSSEEAEDMKLEY